MTAAFARHSRESGNPWTSPGMPATGKAKSLDSRFRGNDDFVSGVM